ncbi:MAG: hypothetical protein II507_01520, partial [Treponema sp.]|nr:hypothetical protein [Treponema sp.]
WIFFWIAEAKDFCMLLTRPPWLDIAWQETNPFPELVEGNISQKTPVEKKGFLGISRNVERYGP